MATLYRKYRPQNFEEVVGQNHIKLTLEQEIKTGKVAHSYLFCGPRAVGKTTLARVLAKAFNCQNRKEGDAEPCNKCTSCQEITGGRALDVIEIDAASHTGVDNVRENIIANARVSPVSLKFKVFIIDEVHMLSSPAFNALLKIMEEPPAFVIFILCTTEVHKIPTTVISRCQRFDFKKISVTDIVKKLEYIVRNENIRVDRKILEGIARYSGGHMRDAESLLGQIVALIDTSGSKNLEITSQEAELVIPRNDLDEVISLIESLSKKDTGKAIRILNKLVDDGFDLKVFTMNLIEILRQMILTKINPNLIVSFGLELGESLEARMVEVNKGLNINQLMRYIDGFIKAEPQLKDSFIAQLPLELAVIEICSEAQPSRPSAPVKIADKPISTNPKASDEITAKWPEFLNRVKQNNHSLSFILKSCRLSGIEGSQVCLTFRHKFHKDRISETETKHLIESALTDIYGAKLTIKALLDENLIIENGIVDKTEINSNNNDKDVVNNTNNEAINNVLKNFGGKIVG
ncbi:MAG: DNA polymerase III subunit gamma/tau [bacterium]